MRFTSCAGTVARALAPLPRLCLLLLPLLGPPAALRAQEAPVLTVSDTVVEIRLAGGEAYLGRVVAVEGETVTLESTAGVRVQLPRARIVSARAVRGRIENGVFWREDPHRTRLFFAPTGRSLPAGEGYVGVFELFFPFVSFGVTDRITLSGGTPVVPDLVGEVVYLAPKVGVIQTPSFQLSAGVLALLSLTESEGSSEGILYGVGTWGSADHALTAGAGWGFAGTDVSGLPALLLGGETRLSGRVKLISENYLISWRETVGSPTRGTTERRTERVGLLSGGIRIFGERLSADAGVGVGFGEGEVGCCVPLVNFVYTFGGGR